MKAKPFLVGSKTERGTRVVVLREARAPIRGPFTLRGVVTGRREPAPSER